LGIASDPLGDGVAHCSVPGCRRLTALATGTGRAPFHCRYHVQHKARHGSHWCKTYLARDLRPYAVAASDWLLDSRNASATAPALSELSWTLAFAGRVDPAMNLRGQPAAYRAHVAFARLREAGVDPRRLLAIYLGVSALIQDDLGSHRVREFKIVQAAKAVHRLASGTHRRWHFERRDGTPGVTELHAYPKSSGLVLRRIGETLERACEPIAQSAVPAIIARKVERHGTHPSHQRTPRR
jgi:hypothetical protein